MLIVNQHSNYDLPKEPEWAQNGNNRKLQILHCKSHVLRDSKHQYKLSEKGLRASYQTYM